MMRPSARSAATLGHDLLAVAVMLLFASGAGALLTRHRHATRPVHPTITLAETRAHVASGDALILDARERNAYAAGHIPGALSLPVTEWKARSRELRPMLRAHRDRLVIVYCSDTWCGLADELQQALADLGHTRVGRFAQGFNAWRDAGLSVEETP